MIYIIYGVLWLCPRKVALLSKWASEQMSSKLFLFLSLSALYLPLPISSLPSLYLPPPPPHLPSLSGCVICHSPLHSSQMLHLNQVLLWTATPPCFHQSIIHSCSTKMKRVNGRQQWDGGYPVAWRAKANNMYHVCLHLAFDPCRMIISVHLFCYSLLSHVEQNCIF